MMSSSAGTCSAQAQLAAVFDADLIPTVVLNDANKIFYCNSPGQDALQQKFLDEAQPVGIDIKLFSQLSVTAQKTFFAEQILPTLDIGRLLSHSHVKPVRFSLQDQTLHRFSLLPKQAFNESLDTDLKTMLLTGWHDIRNLLGITRNQIELLQIQERSLSVDAVDRLQKINEAAKTAVMIAEKMTSFQVQHVPVQDGNALLKSAAVILTGIVPVDMHLEVITGSEPLPVKLSQSGLNNALVNLVINAVDASPAGSSISVSCTAQLHPQIGKAVCFSITDQGCGIDDVYKQAALGAYFSGKSDNQIHGLGLFSVQQFVTAAGGLMEIADNTPAGTHVRLFFPWQTNA